MEQLVIRLGNHMHDTVHWVVWSITTQEVIASGELAAASDLSTLSERTSHSKALIIVPGASVRLNWVTLPGKAQPQIAQRYPLYARR